EAGKTAEAKTLLLKACDGDIEQGCALAAAMTKPADGPEARKLLTRGCALGMAQACDALAGNDDASRRSACESGGVESCADLAFKLGDEAERQHKWEQMEETIGLLQQACRRGSMRSCNVLGHVAKDAIRSCDADNGPQCLVAGFVHSQGISMPSLNGPTIPADANKAKADFARACRLGVKSACGR